MKKVVFALLIAGLVMVAPRGADAAFLFGELSIAGLGDVRVTITPTGQVIDWGETGTVFGTPVGDILFVTADGSFAPLALTPGEIEDLNSVAHPVATPISEHNFIRAFAMPSLDFVLEFIFQGAGTTAGCNDAPGSVCTPGVSPFTITNNSSGGSSVEFSVRGTVSDGSGDPPSPFIGNFTTQFPTLTAGEILAQLQSQGFIQSSHSSEFVITAIPEPASLLLFGTGLAGFAAARRRRNRKE